jgi:hypothetical protein
MAVFYAVRRKAFFATTPIRVSGALLMRFARGAGSRRVAGSVHSAVAAVRKSQANGCLKKVVICACEWGLF